MDGKLTAALKSFREDYPKFKELGNDELLFSVFCAKYFFFDEEDIRFDASDFWGNALTDGANDGGTDAIFRDPSGNTNDIIIVQSKYVRTLSFKTLRNEITKLLRTVRDFLNNDCSRYNDHVKRAYDRSMRGIDDESEVKFRAVYFTTWKPTVAQRSRFERFCAQRSTEHCAIEIRFGDDIEGRIKECEVGEERAAHGVLVVDRPGNRLQYGKKAFVANVSARSLKKLYRANVRSAFGMNLRYHISKGSLNGKVDDRMKDTIEKRPDKFWYFNNGILVVCEKFKFADRGLKIDLENFSIVNGGQTTYNIAHAGDLPKDFYLPCKVIEVPSDGSGIGLCDDIAEYTNTQKPIKPADLYANRPDQKLLAIKLERCGVTYLRKAGDKAERGKKKYQRATIVEVGRVGLAGVMLLPGSARSKPGTMFDDKVCHDAIFGSAARPQFLADLLYAGCSYHEFACTMKKKRSYHGVGLNAGELKGVIATADTFVLASIAFLKKIKEGAFGVSEFNRAVRCESSRTRERTFKSMRGIDRLFHSAPDYEDGEYLWGLFLEIVKLLAKVYHKEYLEAKKRGDASRINPSNFFKKDDSFYSKCVPVLYSSFRRRRSKLRIAYDSVIG